MIPTLLITLREVIEASLIVATILGILTKLNQKKHIHAVWAASASAIAISFLLVVAGSTVGINIQKIIDGPSFEGGISILSACFVTWAVFFLHTHFAQKKMHLLSKISETIEHDGIFAFTFIAVFREGIEITLFLSTLYVTSTPFSIVSGYCIGLVLGIAVSILFFRATVRLPIYWTFRVTSALLIVSAGNLLARGIGELLEIMPFHIASSVNTLPLIAALTYIFLMHRRVFVRSH